MSSTFITVCTHAEHKWVSCKISPQETTILHKSDDEKWIRRMAIYHASVTGCKYRELFVTVLPGVDTTFNVTLYDSIHRQFTVILAQRQSELDAIREGKEAATKSHLPFIAAIVRNSIVTPK